MLRGERDGDVYRQTESHSVEMEKSVRGHIPTTAGKALDCRVGRSGLYPESCEKLLKQWSVGMEESKPQSESFINCA